MKKRKQNWKQLPVKRMKQRKNMTEKQSRL